MNPSPEFAASVAFCTTAIPLAVAWIAERLWLARPRRRPRALLITDAR